MKELFFFSSTSASDTSGTIVFEYLNGEFEIKTATLTPNGQNAVTGPTDFFRIRDVTVFTGLFVGDIYFFSPTSTLTGGVPDDDTTIQTVIPQEFGRLVDINYTTPKGNITFFAQTVTTTTGGQNADIVTQTIARPTQLTVPLIAPNILLGPSSIFDSINPFPPGGLPEGLSIIFRINSLANNAAYSSRIFFIEYEIDVFKKFFGIPSFP